MDIGLIKRRAKESIKRNYWPAVIGALLITASVATPTAVVKVNVNDISDLNSFKSLEEVLINELNNILKNIL